MQGKNYDLIPSIPSIRIQHIRTVHYVDKTRHLSLLSKSQIRVEVVIIVFVPCT